MIDQPSFRPRHARIAAMQLVFQLDAGNEISGEDVESFLADVDLRQAESEHAQELAQQTWSQRGRIDKLIEQASAHWSIKRVSAVDRAIMRIAIAEMILIKKTPVKVAINEAIELAKEFSSEESSRFVNGVLDAVRSTFAEHS